MASRPWSRDETLAALNLYCRTPFGRLHARNPDIIALAGALGRTPNAVAMKCCNLASFDPDLRARGIRGLSKRSRLDEEVWNEFHQDTERVGYESETAFARLTQSRPRAVEVVQWEDVQGLDKESLVRVRVNQHLFRSIILAGYGFQCAVCTLPIPTLLVAAHIVPWSRDKSLRMNPRNGICLCSLHDRAFDTGLLVICGDFRIDIHPRAHQFKENPAVNGFLLAYSGKSISLPDRWRPSAELLERHAQMISGSV